ncbi:transcription antitermination factor NusB [Wolinella succinogenes]|jgi:N utilization substance protein B|uniref:Transcription antitermination protein NusB n=1 Tax=Wolinella succinogenes (strain ATCC 29543 / DSM 1740 / CCUG 13145 / JCM 31913 / LMG 7466 / NCTC 11488 / FDC 602W) TaxID=273121 RepID=NUSB_WOLSU|nr:transcription antitermination factor NusB [Wolinella succinogenes]Q7MAE9.1 RecName: Full=Transcription antitermination protein NusB; AltName: Full=Antitermination factor NusB [Wolinella succinogenes DSM 1740]HCZ19871.1 transcription antitermination factor NusB [Helicobacter sp.]NLU35381.1 transcription antitermination factor NusB [Wolinella succinogenes]CAE09447.1 TRANSCRIPTION TERMINATION PROTEIN [Wolinella succinogenes]VEG81660.1 N utilization substance protein B homolog [Wolinella succin
MATRAQAREAVVSLLYAYDMGNTEIRKFAIELLEEKRIKNRQQEFALELFDGTIAHLGEIDEEIKKHLKEWDFSRIGDMERAILRLGTFEIVYSGVDRAVIINEAVELSKTFGNDNSPRFVNGVLDALRPDLKKG